MSQFNHNSKLWEQMAFAWHVLGTFVSLWGYFSALGAVGASMAMQKVLVILPGLFENYYWSSWSNATVFGVGALFHVWATYQHLMVIRKNRWELYT